MIKKKTKGRLLAIVTAVLLLTGMYLWGNDHPLAKWSILISVLIGTLAFFILRVPGVGFLGIKKGYSGAEIGFVAVVLVVLGILLGVWLF